jgi:hypothetical protein
MHTIPRRQALRQLALVAVGCTAACTPLRVLVNAYPRAFDEDDTLVERVLRAFVTAVIPGARSDDPDLIRAHLDPAYPFAQYAGFFAADLSRRAGRAFEGRPFERLELAERTAVVREGLAADATTSKLYNGAVVLAQIACYAGMYDDRKGCPMIGFEGGYHWHSATDITHPDAARFLSHARTADGNYT